MQEIQSRLKLCFELVKASEETILKHYQQPLEIERKADASEVTSVDKEVETLIRQRIGDAFAGDGIIGEEFQEDPNPGADFRWTIDPIDGTSHFVHGMPLFGTLISVIHENDVVCGIAHYPVARETIYGFRGEGAFWKKFGTEKFERCQVSKVNRFQDATLGHSGYEYFKQVGQEDLLLRFSSTCSRTRTYGCCYGFMMVATGRADIMLESWVHLWDFAPFKVILEEAGGQLFDLQGRVGIDIKSAVGTNSHLKYPSLHLIEAL